MEVYKEKVNSMNFPHKTKQKLFSKFAQIIQDYKKDSIFSKFRDQIANKTFNFDNVKLIVAQLAKDMTNYYSDERVSECAYFAPRFIGKSELKRKVCEQLADDLFTDHIMTPHKKRVKYAQLISKLTQKFLDQEFSQHIDKMSYKVTRLSEYRDLWESLKNSEFSDAIINPKAMPVEIAEKDDLEEFFSFIAADMEVQKEKTKDYDTQWLDEHECLKFNRGAIYKDGRMDLCKQVVGYKWIGDLMDSLKKNKQVKHFLLGNNIIGTTGALAIKFFLADSDRPNIHTWYLAGNDIDSEGISYLVDGLQNDTDCKELWLKRNPLKTEGFKQIKRLVQKNKHIKTLDLDNTAPMDDGIKHLFEGLKENYAIENLYLDACAITSKGAEYITEYFKYLNDNDLKGVTGLWLSMNRIYDDAMIELLKVLKDYSHLKRLTISSNGLSEKTGEQIYESFRDHPSLISLDLGMYKSTVDMGELVNKLSDTGGKYVAKLIKENKKIRALSVLHNDISDEVIDLMSKALETNTTLLFFDYKQYFVPINSTISNRINECLTRNKKANNISDPDKRFILHTKEIVNIDSIYRNNDK